jgi:hypothetical protein
LNDAPNGYGSRVALARRSADQPVVATCLGQFHGDAEAVRAFFAELPTPKKYEIKTLSYTDAQAYLDEVLDPLYFHENSMYVADTPSLAFLEDGAVNDVAQSATAFAHRNARWLMVTGLTWSETDTSDTIDRNLEWQRRFYKSALPIGTGGSYGNLLDPTLENWADAYFATNLNRLSKIKRLMDPNGLFARPQGVPQPRQDCASLEASTQRRNGRKKLLVADG